MIIYKKGYTHSGRFHADDVFSTALLKILDADFRVLRVSEVPEEPDGIVYDIGGGAYDHHQPDSPVRENGVPYAAFGLLWREYGAYILGSAEAAERFDRNFIASVDLSDNTGCFDTLSEAIAAFNPPWNSSDDRDAAFEQAVDAAYIILKKMTEKIKADMLAYDKVKAACKNAGDRIVVLDEYLPWENAAAETDALFVIYPSSRGGFNIQGVPAEPGSKELKCHFPAEWRGLENEELQSVSGIDGLRFCHKSGFLAAANDMDSAVSAAETAINFLG